MEIPTPCRGICKYDPDTDWCIGCGRTKAEVSQWSSYPQDQRLRLIRNELKRRLKQMGRWPMTGK